MHAQPGVYAVLLGSGVSTGAGIPTGWGIVKDLVRRIAAINFAEDQSVIDAAEVDPESWWTKHGSGELGYSSLLESIAPTPATRQGILRSFFEPTDEDRNEGIKVPSRAHLSLAELVKRGSVKVILTTNFDRLTERALESVGISPQVISRPEAVNGMAPLAHADATVIKLHGDYLDLGSRNTPDELQDYPDEWKNILAQVVDEYGLIISGWSADWDTALVSAIESASSRRYPLYWDRRSSKGENAGRLLATRKGMVLDVASADELFANLSDGIDALDRLTEPPLTTAMAVARLKRYLPDPAARINLNDLVMTALDRAVDAIKGQTFHVGHEEVPKRLEELLDAHYHASLPLLNLLATGTWFDRGLDHLDLWKEVVQRLLDARVIPDTAFQGPVSEFQHFPALLAYEVIGLVAANRGRDRLLLEISTKVKWRNLEYPNNMAPAAQQLHIQRVLGQGNLKTIPRWEGKEPYYPESRLMRFYLRDVFSSLIPEERTYAESFDSLEYLIGIIQQRTQGQTRSYHPNQGEFLIADYDGSDGIPHAETYLRESSAEQRDRWPWRALIGDEYEIDEVLNSYREALSQAKRRNF
ncbi:SIR2 family protein [Amycolatopsis rhabdoformis]|uniref:SIR2 family protein n=1 Tax=Amycolatopsis rhabdoformis TaxID=1448059 RepID=A0ABZ1I3U0_9PSEU|nr:SIR2 family protein [Amycolatopsis rhabdoformis]WSE29062.1 SIR2 family protein [Amycolatopsis rhabdoformis]